MPIKPHAALAAHKDMPLLLATFGGMLLLMMSEQLRPRRSDATNPDVRWLINWNTAGFSHRVADSNYGSTVPWFAYLFGPARETSREDLQDMPLGVESAPAPARPRAA